jgi:WD40 repeat protein
LIARFERVPPQPQTVIRITNLGSGQQHRIPISDYDGGDYGDETIALSRALLAAHLPKHQGVGLWTLPDAQTAGTLRFPTHDWDTMAFSPDGRWLATSTWTGKSLLLWDVASRASYATPVKEAAAIRHLEFTPDGRTLVINTMDNAVSLWRFEALPGRSPTLEEILRELDYICPGPRFTVSPGGRYIALSGKLLPNWEVPLVLWYAPSLAEIDARSQTTTADQGLHPPTVSY